MTTLVLAIGFQSIGEPRFAIDICSTIWRAVHNVPTQRMGNLPAVFGICERISGRLGLTLATTLTEAVACEQS